MCHKCVELFYSDWFVTFGQICFRSSFIQTPTFIPTGCDALIIFTSARPRLHSYTNMINTPAGWWQNSLIVFVSVSLPDVKSINYLNAKNEGWCSPQTGRILLILAPRIFHLAESYLIWMVFCCWWVKILLWSLGNTT